MKRGNIATRPSHVNSLRTIWTESAWYRGLLIGGSPAGVDNVALVLEDDITVAAPRRTGPRVSISGTWKGRGSAASVLWISRIVCPRQIDTEATPTSDVSLSDDASAPLETNSVPLLCPFHRRSLPPPCVYGVLINFPRTQTNSPDLEREGGRLIVRARAQFLPFPPPFDAFYGN